MSNLYDEFYKEQNGPQSDAVVQQAMQNLHRSKRRERLLRMASALVGITLLVGYVIVGKLYGLWGLGLGIVPFATWLIVLSIISNGIAYLSEH